MQMKQNQTFFNRTYSNLTLLMHSKSDVISFLSKILKNFNDFQNQNFLWLKWTQTIEMKQNQTFFYETFSNLMSFFLGCKILYYFNDFHKLFLLQQQRKTRKQVKWNRIKQDTCKSDSIFLYFEIITLFQWLLEFISS